LPQLVRELVQLDMDVIVAVSLTAIGPAKNGTSKIPTVTGFGKDPIRDGVIASLARINLKTAKQIRLNVPSSILARAHRVTLQTPKKLVR
jgi:hypothetical protein